MPRDIRIQFFFSENIEIPSFRGIIIEIAKIFIKNKVFFIVLNFIWTEYLLEIFADKYSVEIKGLILLVILTFHTISHVSFPKHETHGTYIYIRTSE